MCGTLCKLILCLLPPLAVLLFEGCNINLAINIVLTFLAWIPGVMHAIYVFCVEKNIINNKSVL
ncbi:unnamed protein product [Thelazia callipaeda]|uniref:YqaE/Pmp3 family membrane protein n=1 Tax=Thelazia callipaeda TaxID=103827 RepID=A0A0N5D6Z6_THECL|nr:unnamed protein product [Thelazia callipaeda]